MEKVDRIIAHPLWQESLTKIRKAEIDRVFCRHDVAHFLDVARIAYIEDLERGLEIPKELIYAAAMLHDIGRGLEYSEGIPHEKASFDIAKKILQGCGFDTEMENRILNAVGGHRKKETASSDELMGIIYRADKKSRNCMVCNARELCKWSSEDKNMNLQI